MEPETETDPAQCDPVGRLQQPNQFYDLSRPESRGIPWANELRQSGSAITYDERDAVEHRSAPQPACFSRPFPSVPSSSEAGHDPVPLRFFQIVNNSTRLLTSLTTSRIRRRGAVCFNSRCSELLISAYFRHLRRFQSQRAAINLTSPSGSFSTAERDGECPRC